VYGNEKFGQHIMDREEKATPSFSYTKHAKSNIKMKLHKPSNKFISDLI